MVITTVQKEALQGLCSGDRLDLMDAIDRLRSRGVDHLISLPQIIVVGDQSSGKSSVLEAISGVPFPARSNLCTRFPTELVLRRTSQVSARISIVPHTARPDSEKAALSNFDAELATFDDLSRLIEEAKYAMGISTHGNSFGRDLLRVEISGPDRPHLTIVDLPGLIHSETKHQRASDIELIQDTVESYMAEPRSIILAVVSAKNDFSNQVVLKLARSADSEGKRTLGVITKPDTLHPGSQSEALYVSLARNREFEFRLGWHVLKNLDSETQQITSSHRRNTLEETFFGQGIWTTLPGNILGVSHLRSRLSKVLLTHIASELPGLITDIETRRQSCQAGIAKLGRARATHKENQLYLITISESFQRLVRSAADGNCTDGFFKSAESASGYQSRLRAFIQNHNDDFAKTIEKEGHTCHITDHGADDDKVEANDSAKSISREQFIAKIMTKMSHARGRELPGSFDPMIVAELFREQAIPWEQLAHAHIKRSWGSCKLFLKQVVEHVADLNTSATIYQKIIEPAMYEILGNLIGLTKKVLNQHQQLHPITYNQDFPEALQKLRSDRRRDCIASTTMNFFGVSTLTRNSFGTLDLSNLVDRLVVSTLEPDVTRFAASEALDMMQAYYKVAMKRFIDDMAVSVVEVALVSALADILSPAKVFEMDEGVVAALTGETEENRILREQLVQQLEVLENGAEICQRFTIDDTNGTGSNQERQSTLTPDGTGSEGGSEASARGLDIPDSLGEETQPEAEAEQSSRDVHVSKSSKKKKGRITVA
ncbi:dynamin family protein [Microdochium trichocladiopsis]|uniref:Dynamin family protein n=1 Tax=Microdochium trichocladiopsis TaxID=1682393 RepID=A0A9P8XTA9_9PEZI|nr:dynamin family protein [Microdochium trichocladiopsis]KAH7016365.1 dynamin family protein [Microdochium trichocladiopsis]